jgi:hypothetical protein
MDPVIPTSRTTTTANTELVFFLRPRVVVFTTPQAATPRINYMNKVEPTLPDMSDLAPISPVAESLPVEPSKEEAAQINSTSLEKSKPAESSIEIQPLSSVVSSEPKNEVVGDPSVIVNYDVLGK